MLADSITYIQQQGQKVKKIIIIKAKIKIKNTQ